MCTVTFIPINGDHYILTSSRDEQTTRPISPGPSIEDYPNYKLLFPKDPKGGGTWIATSNSRKTICLFNGAFKPHSPKYPYRHSRGIIVLDFFRFPSTKEFIEEYNLIDIEPFTLVIVNNRTLEEFKWDGEQKHFIQHPFGIPKIWSSATLYNSEIIKLRESWFNDWKIKHPNPSKSDILHFHLTGGDGHKEYKILMERPQFALKTVSITSVQTAEKKTMMTYLDLLEGTKCIKEISNT